MISRNNTLNNCNEIDIIVPLSTHCGLKKTNKNFLYFDHKEFIEFDTVW